MTTEQIGELVKALTSMPNQVLLAFALYILYKDVVKLVSAILTWGRDTINELIIMVAKQASAPPDARAP